MDSVSVWEGLFMLVVLKIPIVYLSAVVWWAIRAEPTPEGGSDGPYAFVPLTPCDWRDRHRRATAGKRPFRPRLPFRPLRPIGPPAHAHARATA